MARTVYLCWLDTLEHESGEARVTITLREEGGALAFEIAGNAARSNTGFVRLRDRVEALGGQLTIQSEPGRGARVSGSLPMSRGA